MADNGLLQCRLDYAWRYFESAARQRMLFLNYFLIATGILASAFGFAKKESLDGIAIAVSLVGLVSAIASIIFDIRMLAFVKRALLVLETLERQWLFPDGYTCVGPKGLTKVQLGLARTEPDAKAEDEVDWRTGARPTKVKWWIRVIEGLIAACWAVGFLTSLCAALMA